MPLAWYIMSHWLKQYTYRTEISWWIFAAAGAGALLVTVLTVSYQSVRAARSQSGKKPAYGVAKCRERIVMNYSITIRSR